MSDTETKPETAPKPKTRKHRKTFKTVQRETNAEAAILDGLSEVESLKDEMCEARDNMEGTNLESTSKFQTISETADTLENIEYQPDIPEGLPEDLKVTYFENLPYGKSALSRATRMSNAVSMISAGLAGIEEHMDKVDGEKSDLRTRADEIRSEAEDQILDCGIEEKEMTEEEKEAARADANHAATMVENEIEKLDEIYDALETFKDEIENTISEIENVEFPGMYG